MGKGTQASLQAAFLQAARAYRAAWYPTGVQLYAARASSAKAGRAWVAYYTPSVKALYSAYATARAAYRLAGGTPPRLVGPLAPKAAPRAQRALKVVATPPRLVGAAATSGFLHRPLAIPPTPVAVVS